MPRAHARISAVAPRVANLQLESTLNVSIAIETAQMSEALSLLKGHLRAL